MVIVFIVVALTSHHPIRVIATKWPSEAVKAQADRKNPPDDAISGPCALMKNAEDQAAEFYNTNRYEKAYNAAVSGLSNVDDCSARAENVFVNQGYLLSSKGLAEHHLKINDWKTDLNQANALLAKCQSTPSLYGTHRGAQCETQEQNNISNMTEWDIESSE